ncbi:MAG TPA: MMPL family transporter [Candidatus Binatia bacterium]|nr:MMPL family transporter [Candidatus Binatia bacterium]
MLSRKAIEAYLYFLLRHRLLVSIVVGLLTVGLAASMWFRMHVFTNFFDLYPPNHPYIRLYQQYRNMFGTANTVLIVVEVKNGTIFDDPATVQKVDRITLALLHDIPGVNGDQVLSITHPKVKTTLTAGSGIKVVPLMYPRVPENKDDLEFLKLKVYTTEGVHGFFVSDDDKATLITAGFWEEYFDLPTMWAKIQEIVKRESDANTTIYVSGPPILYAYFMEIMPKMVGVLAASIVMILLILWIEFRSWQGVVIPAFSGALSAVWGLGFGGLWGLNLDPLVLVIPLLISARAHSHSVQSMERYHEEYHRLRDKDQAIVKSYTEIYAPAMVSLLADGLAVLTLLVARIPIIQKLAILCSFWIISIFVSVVTLHPIILSFTPPPEEQASGKGALERFMAWLMLTAVAWLVVLYGYAPHLAGWRMDVGSIEKVLAGVLVCGLLDACGVVVPGYAHVGRGVSVAIDALGSSCTRLYGVIERALIWMALGWRRVAMAATLVVLLGFGLYFQHQLRIGDTTPGAALLYADHPYNVAFRKVNEKFVGASQLVIIAEGAAYCAVDGKPCVGDACVRCRPESPETCGKQQCLQRDGAIEHADTLNNLDLFARYMAERPEVGGTVTAASLLKKIFRTFHEGDPKWEILPTRNDHVSQLFFLLTSGTRRGEMDRFFDANYANATIQVFYKDYTHDTIENSIARAKQYIAEHGGEAQRVRYRLAGGLIGILAAVNEEVEWSYRVNLLLILVVVFLLSYATYVSVIGALIVMLPSLVAQPLSEAVMYLLGIDMNINSLPVAAVGIGIGIDYGYYVLSRIVEELSAGEGFDVAIRRTFETTGKTVLFTGVSLTASIIFWVFFPMKFQAQMALLLVLLLAFHLMGALMFIPPMVSLFKPSFAIKYAEERRERIRAEAAAEARAAEMHAAGP